MRQRQFDLASFYAYVGASAKERSALRQDLVRGLKDWHQYLYGYDRYGAETIFLLPERMGVPRIFGFAMVRILHDRRISDEVKVRTVEMALDIADYGDELGPPFGLPVGLHFLALRDRLPVQDLRYALVLTAGDERPFESVEKAISVDFLRWLLGSHEMPTEERAFWGHSLLSRHHGDTGAADLINLFLGSDEIPAELRRELCLAWVNARQPHIDVPVPASSSGFRSSFVADHMPFWVAHMRSWPGPLMVRYGLLWLARLGEDPLTLAQRHMDPADGFAEQLHGAVADIIAEHNASMPEPEVRSLIERGIGISGSGPTRRRFYRLGSQLFGAEYLERATHDTAGSVRQWAARELQRQA